MRLFRLTVTGNGTIVHKVHFTGPEYKKSVTVTGIYSSGWGYVDTNQEFYPLECHFENDQTIPIHGIEGLDNLVIQRGKRYEFKFSPNCNWNQEEEDEKDWFVSIVETSSKGPRMIDFTTFQRGGVALESGIIKGPFTIDEVDPDTKAVIKANMSLEDFFASNEVNVLDMDNNGVAPLHLAVIEGSLDEVNRLLANHANINLRTYECDVAPCANKTTPLILSVIYDRPNIFHRLIEAGADIHAIDVHCRNALFLALEASESGENPPDHYDGYIDTLLELGADYKLRDVFPIGHCLAAYEAYARRKEKRTLLLKGNDLPKRVQKTL
ncbi:MAG: ankyrin repeat domain-containing protein [Gallionella sp.]